MRFLIITHVTHKKEGDSWYAYGPYVKEMNLWLKYVDEVTIVAPVVSGKPGAIEIPYRHSHIRFVPVKEMAFNRMPAAFVSLLYLPGIFFKVIKAMHKTDHIHLRCPGNMGLIGCVAQIFFPQKIKTAKYAGNWDHNSRQPFTYRLQRQLLRNTLVAQNMTALVYGNWPKGTKNIK